MLEKPDLPDEKIAACLGDEYGLNAAQIAFLPLGADQRTAVYRVVAGDGTPYFCKLRRGTFNESFLALARFFSDQGIPQVIPHLTTRTGKLWAGVDAFKIILYPFVEGKNGYEVELSDQHWIDLGQALRRIQTTALPPELLGHIPQETFASRWRESVLRSLELAENEAFDDPVAKELAAFVRTRAVLSRIRRNAGQSDCTGILSLRTHHRGPCSRVRADIPDPRSRPGSTAGAGLSEIKLSAEQRAGYSQQANQQAKIMRGTERAKEGTRRQKA